MKILCAETKIWHSQINNIFKNGQTGALPSRRLAFRGGAISAWTKQQNQTESTKGLWRCSEVAVNRSEEGESNSTWHQWWLFDMGPTGRKGLRMQRKEILCGRILEAKARRRGKCKWVRGTRSSQAAAHETRSRQSIGIYLWGGWKVRPRGWFYIMNSRESWKVTL